MHCSSITFYSPSATQRDPDLPRFQQWIDTELDGLPDEVRQPEAVKFLLGLHETSRPAGRRINGPAYGAMGHGPMRDAVTSFLGLRCQADRAP